MEPLLLSLLNGLSFAMLLFLITSGMVLAYGVMGVINLAQGVFYVLGVYLGLEVFSRVPNFWLAALLGGAGVSILSLLLERVFFSRLHKQHNEQVLLTVGIVSIFISVAVWVWGPFAQLVPTPPVFSALVRIGQASFPVYRLVLIGIGLAIAALLWFFIEKTRAGAKVRAGIDDQEMTTGLGIDFALISSAIFLLAGFLSGFAGFIGGPVMVTTPGMAWDIVLLGLVVTVVGGASRPVQGTLVGCLIVGMIDSLGKSYFPDFAYFTIYLVMIIVLLVKPTGILARTE